MVAVDTNVVVRLLTRDDETQYQASYALFKAEEIFIPESVILETAWVLEYAYHFAPAAMCAALRKLLGLNNVHLASPAELAKVLEWHEAGLDFADALHLARCQHLPQFKTFDERFIRRAQGLSGCVVAKP